jgi:hypothetical protein
MEPHHDPQPNEWDEYALNKFYDILREITHELEQQRDLLEEIFQMLAKKEDDSWRTKARRSSPTARYSR